MKLLLLIVLGVVTLQLSLSVAIGRTFYTKPVMIKASVEDNTPANFIIVSLSKSLKVLGKGVELTWTKYKDYNRIRKIKRKQGSSSISFTEFKLLQSAKEDLSKAFRMLVMLPLSPEFFIYSYLLGPIISTAKSPWAWAAYPSTFDDTDDKAIRDRVVSGRRTQAAVFGLYTLQSVMIDELDASRKAQREAEFKMVEKALKAKSPEEGMKVLQPWFATYRRKNEATDKLDLTKVPGGIVKQFLRGLGSDGVPNIPLVRRLNNAEVKKYIDTVRNGDEFLQQKGIKHLSNEEVCFYLFIIIIVFSNKTFDLYFL